MSLEDNAKGTGKVWLVGAGPSDAELLTVKGRRLLAEADVIVYDRLAGVGVLAWGRPDAVYIDVGKRAGHHPIPQEEINRILVEQAEEGRRVVRLKGGDPLVFGRGGEEASALKRAGVPFEIVPGITSAIAVPAYLGIPVTHRDLASSLHIVTAHKKDGSLPDIRYQALVEGGGTLVFLMGVHTIRSVTAGLLAEGMSPDMPAAVLERGDPGCAAQDHRDGGGACAEGRGGPRPVSGHHPGGAGGCLPGHGLVRGAAIGRRKDPGHTTAGAHPAA